jgi:hypothetical protein
MSTPRPQPLRQPAGVGRLTILTTMGVVCMLAWCASGDAFSSDDFDPVRWRQKVPEKLETTCWRGGMARDIQRRIVRPGMARADVIAKLGTPDRQQPEEFSYVLGMCSGIRIDYDDLHVRFNEHGEVAKVLIIQH